MYSRSTASRISEPVFAFACEAARTLPGVCEVALEGGTEAPRYVATLKPGASAQEALRAAFQRGLDLREFRMEAPTLHDAFIVLTERAA